MKRWILLEITGRFLVLRYIVISSTLEEWKKDIILQQQHLLWTEPFTPRGSVVRCWEYRLICPPAGGLCQGTSRLAVASRLINTRAYMLSRHSCSSLWNYKHFAHRLPNLMTGTTLVAMQKSVLTLLYIFPWNESQSTSEEEQCLSTNKCFKH